MGCHFLLQGIFLTQGLNPGLLHRRQMLYCLSHQGSLKLYKNNDKQGLSTNPHACVVVPHAPTLIQIPTGTESIARATLAMGPGPWSVNHLLLRWYLLYFGLQEKSHGAGYWTETSYAPTYRPHWGLSLNHSLLPAITPQLWMVAFLPLSLQQRQELLEFSKKCGSSRAEKKEKGREKRKERRCPTWQLNGTSLNPATSSNGTCCVQLLSAERTGLIIASGSSFLFLLQLSDLPVNLPSILDGKHLFSPSPGESQAGQGPFNPFQLQFPNSLRSDFGCGLDKDI